ncbi:nodulin-related protein 1-like [Chenopodium quinoa]|uniref:Uncharacterized protein n=1 Tax=Chenopodium quinoa TaxID=63459 RepID=A0A803L7W1_CHEQI|nr:nodulin-related protein 1-like [Chenopodium quinoa]
MAEETPKSQTPTKSPSELMASARVQVSGAATDVINAAKSYGKPDGESDVGHYVGKAEDYLHQLHSPSDQGAEKKAEAVVAAAEGGEKKAEAVVAEAEGGEKKAESVVAAAEGGQKNAESVVAAAEGGQRKAESVVAAEEGEKKAESAAAEGDENKVESTGGVGGLINKAKGLFK